MAANGVTKVKDNLPKVLRGLQILTANQVMVGVPSNTSGRSDSINNAALAYIHDNGAPEANIPARPFMLPGINSKRDEIVARLKKIGEDGLKGLPDAVDRGLNALGLVASGAIKSKINEGVPPPLAPSTLSARRSRGRTGEKPLIDTGQLRNAITYVIRRV